MADKTSSHSQLPYSTPLQLLKLLNHLMKPLHVLCLTLRPLPPHKFHYISPLTHPLDIGALVIGFPQYSVTQMCTSQAAYFKSIVQVQY